MEWVTSMGSEQTNPVVVDELLEVIRENAQMTLDLVLQLCATKTKPE